MLKMLIEIIGNLFYLALHVKSAGSFPPPLKAKEESELLQKSAAGDIQARNKLIEHNLRLVAHIVKKFETKTNDTDDLIGIGTIGLINELPLLILNEIGVREEGIITGGRFCYKTESFSLEDMDSFFDNKLVKKQISVWLGAVAEQYLFLNLKKI